MSVVLLLTQFSSPVLRPTSLHVPTFKTEKIPNIVHFVHLLEPNKTSNPVLEFPFRQFVAIYSAWYYLQPQAIYIHTNIEDRLIEQALIRSTNPYSKVVSKLPGIKFNLQIAPNRTTSGDRIDKLPNQSDFVRTTILKEFGGIYLDDDSYVLRDLKPLRRLGFENVVGWQENGQICPAVILSTPKNKLMDAYHVLQDKVFDPDKWAQHATDLLTTLARDFQEPGGQILILPQDTFFPYSWVPAGLQNIYQVKSAPGRDPIVNKDTENMTDYIDNFQLVPPNTWQKDWRSTYVLHGWTSGIEMQLNDKQRAAMFGKYKSITLEYVLSKSNNFARAVYPAVKHALDTGVIDSFDK